VRQNHQSTKEEDLNRGTIFELRKKLGTNLSNNYSSSSNMTKTTFNQDIEEFLCQDDITKQAHAKMKQSHGKQIRYLLNHSSTIHQRFVSETNNNCHYSIFTCYVSDFVVKPNAHD